MRTLIIGANGMLGVELAKAFAPDNPTLWTRDDLDITDQRQVTEKIAALAPELIINAAAYTNVDACEENEDEAARVNGAAAGYLAEAALKLGATLVHFSTDYVFDGSKQAGYTEGDTPNPINTYGRTKLAGERAIQSSGLVSYCLIRTSWLYGHSGNNFVETMLSLAGKGESIKVVDDQIGSPTYAPDLAQATLELVKSKKPHGIYHRTNSGTTSWHGFAKEIFTVFNREVDLEPCTTAEFPRPAKRPAFSVLRSTKLEPMRSWQEALHEYAAHSHG